MQLNPYTIITSAEDKRLLVILATTISLVFLVLFNPFGMPGSFVSVIHLLHIMSFGPAFGLAVLLCEFPLRRVCFKEKPINLRYAVLWFLWESLVIAVFIYLFDAMQHWSFSLTFGPIPELFIEFMWIYLLIIFMCSMVVKNRNLKKELISAHQDAGESKIPDYQKRRISIKGRNQKEILYIKVEDLLFISSEANYVKIFYKGADETLKKILLRATLQKTLEELAPYGFIQTHRTTIVNEKQIERMCRLKGRTYLFLRIFDLKVPVSDKYYRFYEE